MFDGSNCGENKRRYGGMTNMWRERHKTLGQLTEEQIHILRSLVRSFLAISNLYHVLHSSCRGFISTKAAYFSGQRVEVMVHRSKGSCGHFFFVLCLEV